MKTSIIVDLPLASFKPVGKTLVFTYTNYGYCDFIINSINTMKRAGITWQPLIFCLDEQAYKFLGTLGYQVYLFKGDSSIQHRLYSQHEYKQIVFHKLDIFMSLVHSYNTQTDVPFDRFLYFDGDVMFYNDPLPYLEPLLPADTDLWSVYQYGRGDQIIPNDKYCCTGFIYSTFNPDLLQFFNYSQVDSTNTPMDGDQDWINWHFEQGRYSTDKIAVLRPDLFPNGSLRNYYFPERYILHYNFLTAEKKEVMAKFGDWLIPTTLFGQDFKPQILVDYPPYAEMLGEQYVYNRLVYKNSPVVKYYLDIFWTNLYVNRDQFNTPYNEAGLIAKLTQLNGGKYFTLIQHDDGIKQKLPAGTTIFSSGCGRKEYIPIPLTYHDSQNRLSVWQNKPKNVFCSFVGSPTHPVRNHMVNTLKNKADIVIKYNPGWSNKVSSSDLEAFLDLTSRSIFCLCPRGYGVTSFRLYEALNLDAIPVYIWQEYEWLPYREFIDYSRLIVSVEIKDIGTLYDRLKAISPQQIADMRAYYQEVKHWFSLDGTAEYIERYLQGTLPTLAPKSVETKISLEPEFKLAELTLNDTVNVDMDLTPLLTGKANTLFFTLEKGGFGAMVSRVMTGMAIAIHYGYNIHFEAKGWEYTFPFHLPITPLSFDEIRKRSKFGFKQDPAPIQEWEFLPYFHYPKNPEPRKEFQLPACPLPLDLNRHQWCAKLMKFMADHPNPQLNHIVTDTKAKLGWNKYSNILGLHIRMGDKIVANDLPAVSLYAGYINRIKAKYNIDAIFLTSDDDQIYTEVQKYTSLPILYDAEEIRYNDCNNERVAGRPDLAEQESYTSAKNILLLGQCQYVLGLHNTQFTWLGGLICVANNKYETNRHIMIDANNHVQLSHWGFDYWPKESKICQVAEL